MHILASMIGLLIAVFCIAAIWGAYKIQRSVENKLFGRSSLDGISKNARLGMMVLYTVGTILGTWLFVWGAFVGDYER